MKHFTHTRSIIHYWIRDQEEKLSDREGEVELGGVGGGKYLDYEKLERGG
jgi:hypothetical protein